MPIKRHFGSHLSDLYSHLPVIVAELAEDVTFVDGGFRIVHDRSSRVYLVLSRENPLESETVDCLARTALNRMKLREIPWDKIRFPDIARVPAVIGQHCWRGTKEEMEAMVAQIKATKMKPVTNFAPDIDL